MYGKSVQGSGDGVVGVTLTRKGPDEEIESPEVRRWCHPGVPPVSSDLNIRGTQELVRRSPLSSRLKQ